jgi:hypothetical protein|uniref:Uncharacterized protein n=1 Tax=viral metagenome TaxID=1070528 RepID=A0A6C0CFH1_9ZZZZ
MIDVLYNKLGVCNDVSLAEWKDIDAAIFKRHSQGSHQDTLVSLNTFIPEEDKPAKQDKPAKPVLASPKDTIFGTAAANAVIAAATAKVAATDKKKSSKDNSVKPLNIIMSETISFHNSTEHIKDALITLISKEEFSKVFGLTKCAEIMSGVVNNRWNKSTALFISFLLDKEVYYNEKVVIYNKEKNRGRVIIS